MGCQRRWSGSKQFLVQGIIDTLIPNDHFFGVVQFLFDGGKSKITFFDDLIDHRAVGWVEEQVDHNIDISVQFIVEIRAVAQEPANDRLGKLGLKPESMNNNWS